MKKKIVVLGLAGCLTLGSISFASDSKDIDNNTKNEIATPIPISNETILNMIKVETKVITPNIDNAKFEIKIPVIKGLKDLAYQEQLNYIIENTTEKDLEAFKEQLEDISKLNVEWEPEMNVGYEVKSNGDILSFVVDSYFFTGGAHGSSRRDYYNIDINANKAVELAGLFKEDSNFKTIINDEINKQIDKQMAEEKSSYFKGEEGFVTVRDAQSFYIDKDGSLVITFQPYDIAPWSMGHPEFKIPNEIIAPILKNVKPVIINGREIKLKNPMFKSEKGTLMMPLAEVARELGFKVTWDGKNKIAKINKGPVSAGAYIGKDQYYFSKALVHLEEEAKLIKGTTFVPVSFIDKVIKGEKSINSDGILNIKY